MLLLNLIIEIMKYFFIFLKLFFLFVYSNSFSQVGIGTMTPYPSSILDLSSSDKSLLLPRVDDVSLINSPTNGMIVFDISNTCVRAFENGNWSNCFSSFSSTNVSVNCNLNGFEGSYLNGIPMISSNLFSIRLTNNTLSNVSINFSTTDLILSGVPGLTVSSVNIPSSNLSPGSSVTVRYFITGTPSSTGVLNATWTKFSLTCQKSINIVNAPISSIDCDNPINYGTLISGIPAFDVSSTFQYTGGDGSSYLARNFPSLATGVTGLTARLPAGNFASGNGSVTLNITGTPSGTGVATFNLVIGFRTCTLQLNVIQMPTNIQLSQSKTHFITSVFDNDYLPYTVPTTTASANVVNADGILESVILNIQGTISTAGTQIIIPVTATGSGTLPAYQTAKDIPAAFNENNIVRKLIFSWDEQTYTSATRSIVANIRSVGGTFNSKKLDLNAGVGIDGLGVLANSFTYPTNNPGNTSTSSYQVRIVPAIVDKAFGSIDASFNALNHKMIYSPVQAEDGNIWLNNNLGAAISNLDDVNFNYVGQATSINNNRAKGSLFQWGRSPDGHELVTWDGIPPTFVYSTTTVRSNNPVNSLFINSTTAPNDWRVSQNNALWATASSNNNPCPVGFRVPTQAEWNNLRLMANITNQVAGYNSKLKLTNTGLRNINGGPGFAYDVSGYWSSTPDGTNSFRFLLNTTSATANSSIVRAYGTAVRCIKD